MNNEQNEQQEPPRKKRSITSVTLGWLAEKMRRMERIKEEIKSGTHRVDTEKVAAAILNKE